MAETNGIADKPVLVTPDGKPTKEGWHLIGTRFREQMDSQDRPGRGGQSFSYITARQVQDRLDSVIGPGNWSTAYRLLDGNAVECTLTVFGVSKADVGYPNNPGKPEEEPLKSAYSDAFKRAAVAWGVGRFLYGELA